MNKGRVVMALLPVVAFLLVATPFFVTRLIEQRVAAALAAQGASRVEVAIESVGTQHLTFAHIRFVTSGVEVALEGLNLSASALPLQDLWRGTRRDFTLGWTLSALSAPELPFALPPLSGVGNVVMENGALRLTGQLQDAQAQYGAQVTVTEKEAVIERLHGLWQNAVVRVEKISIPLTEQTPIRIPLQVEKLPLSFLLNGLFGKKATGVGMVSGKVMVVVSRQGEVTVEAGAFHGDGVGVLQLSPEALPGNPAQMDIARKALANFHYQELQLTLSPDQQGKVGVHLRLEGNNPTAFDGKAVKLEVHLSGDVLELLQQTLLPMVNPEKLIKKEAQ